LAKWKISLVSIGITLGLLGKDILEKSGSLEQSILGVITMLIGAIFAVSGIFAFISQESKKIQFILKKLLKK